MKITLVLLPNIQLFEPKLVSPLGILYIASMLEQAGHEVSFVDLRDLRRELFDLDISQFSDSDWVGFGPSIAEWYDCNTIASLIREQYPKVKLMVGGPHVSLKPQDAYGLFDAIILGDGEYAVVDVVEGLAFGYSAGGSIVYSYPMIKNLDVLPFPARHLLPEDAIFSDQLCEGTAFRPYAKKSEKATGIVSSRGCSWACAFCDNPPVMKVFRARSPDNVVSEIRNLIDRYGCYHYRFNDDVFTVGRKRVMEMCEKMKPLGVYYRCHTRASLVNKELLEAMRDSGCTEVAFGVESADDNILKLVNKGETVETNKRAIQLCKEVGLMSKAYLIVGMPKETWESVEKMKQFMRDAQPDKWSLSTFLPYYGSEMQKHPEKFGMRIIDDDWRKYYQYDTHQRNWSPIETDVASAQELIEHRRVIWDYLCSEVWRKK